jgi:hypothetical protein
MRYPLTNLFKDGQGANTQSVQFGITLKMSWSIKHPAANESAGP